MAFYWYKVHKKAKIFERTAFQRPKRIYCSKVLNKSQNLLTLASVVWYQQ